MSLTAEIKINGELIGVVEVIRTKPMDRAVVATTRCTYEVRNQHGRTLGTLVHRYGDGPWPLVRRALVLGQNDAEHHRERVRIENELRGHR